ncbi:MAG: aldehyde dehydrogenase family protein [Gammaproteobacteria bacterium]|nr:MAG: aldehyde dehydrogenase family protein [Gammaproteobacteria bacterium]
MKTHDQFYINGQWVEPDNKKLIDVINPSDESVCAQIAIGNANDVNKAAIVASKAFESYGFTSIDERKDYLQAIIKAYKNRYNDIADAISLEMGAPTQLAVKGQAGSGLGHIQTALALLDSYPFTEKLSASTVVKEPIGVCGLITPWNWPINQIACKVAPALAVGCTVILKPSEVAPLSATIFAEVIHEAGLPAGVFNLINGDGPGVGTALSEHPLVDMISFTGSTRAGALVAKNAAPTIKRVAQELGGKSANIILPDADFEKAVKQGARTVFVNSGQSCNAPTRMLVPADKMKQAEEIAAKVASQVVVGAANAETTTMGPVVSEVQFNKIRGLIQKGIDESATLVCGGVEKPEGLGKGYYIQPTVFSNVKNEMLIAKEEIFGPVFAIMPYENIDQAIEIANDTPYGLAGYVQGQDKEMLSYVASRIRAGNISINGKSGDMFTPFGGYKQSGNGREWGAHGFGDFLEIKAISGLD